MTSIIAENIQPGTMLGDAAWAARGASASVSSSSKVLPSKGIAGDVLVVGAASVIVALGQTFYHVARGEFSSLKNTWKPVVQSAGSVPIWDLAHKAGYAITTGAVKGLAASSLLVGICAGPASFLIGYIYDLATDETTREMWRQKPSLMAKHFLKELLLSATIGAIPNAIWNVVFVLSLFALLSAGCPPLAAVLLTAALVAAIVACANVQFGEKAKKVVDESINDLVKKIWHEDLNKEYEALKNRIKSSESQPVPASAE